MRNETAQEDDVCTRRIHMLEGQRNEMKKTPWSFPGSWWWQSLYLISNKRNNDPTIEIMRDEALTDLEGPKIQKIQRGWTRNTPAQSFRKAPFDKLDLWKLHFRAGSSKWAEESCGGITAYGKTVVDYGPPESSYVYQDRPLRKALFENMYAKGRQKMSLLFACHASFSRRVRPLQRWVWNVGSTKKIGPEEADRSSKTTREQIIESAHEAVRKATLEKMDEKGLEDEEKNLARNWYNDGKGEEKQGRGSMSEMTLKSIMNIYEDVPLLERNLTLPDVGATCTNANSHASKYLLNFMMRRIVNDYKQWLKFKFQESMAEERKRWEELGQKTWFNVFAMAVQGPWPKDWRAGWCVELS